MAGRAAQRPRPRPRGRVWRTLTAGDRPYVLALVALVLLIGAMALGPLQVYTAAADRLDALERARDGYATEVEDLEDRVADLEDPEEVELLARSELGLVMPGEEPYVVARPEPDPTLPAARDDEPPADDAWYRRLGRWLGELVGAGG